MITNIFFIPGIHLQKTDFRCPEEFGYYPHPGDCSLYFVCVFGGPLLESCTGGLVYSEDLQTCDWPRNVPCNKKNSVESEDNENINIAIESKKVSNQSLLLLLRSKNPTVSKFVCTLSVVPFCILLQYQILENFITDIFIRNLLKVWINVDKFLFWNKQTYFI